LKNFAKNVIEKSDELKRHGPKMNKRV